MAEAGIGVDMVAIARQPPVSRAACGSFSGPGRSGRCAASLSGSQLGPVSPGSDGLIHSA